MSARGMPNASQARPARRVLSVDSVRSAKPAATRISTKSHQLPMPKSQPTNGDTAFDAKAFLARVGFGRRIVNLKKGETAFAQGDPADAIFYVRKGRLRVTVNSANGKEATITLVGPGEFLGENCMLSAHPLHLSTATAMVDCALLRISKAEMTRDLHQEPELSEMFVSFLLARNARIQADLVDQLFNSSEKRLARILLLLAQFVLRLPSQKAVDELNLSKKIVFCQPSNFPLPDHVNCFVALNRSPSRLEFSEALLGIHSTFDGPMILFENVVQVPHRSVSTAFAQRPLLLTVGNWRRCKSAPGQC